MNNNQKLKEIPIEKKKQLKAYRRFFYKSLFINFLIGLTILISSLMIGMSGYHYFEKMSWLDSYLNAAMILSGMGPTTPLQTNVGKIFAGTFAIFSGIVFLIVMAIILAPVFHHVLQKFHLNDKDK